VSVPARFALNTVTFKRVKTAKNILDRPRHDVVDSGFPICGWWPFKKYVGTIFRARIDAALESIIPFPALQDFVCNIGQVQYTSFGKRRFYGRITHSGGHFFVRMHSCEDSTNNRRMRILNR
jgi:hypothetical protein